MDISVGLVGMALLGILAMSAPPGLSIVLFRVLVKEGVPLESQEFFRNWLIFSFAWLVMFLPNLLAIFFSGNTALPDRLRAASITCAVIIALVLSWFSLILVLRSKLRVKLPDFTKAFPLHFFFLVYLSCAVLLLLHHKKYFDGVLG